MVGIREFGPRFTEWSPGTGRRVEPLRHRVFEGIGIQFRGDGRNDAVLLSFGQPTVELGGLDRECSIAAYQF